MNQHLIKEIQQLKHDVALLKEAENWMGGMKPEHDQPGYTDRMRIEDLQKEVRMLTDTVRQLHEVVTKQAYAPRRTRIANLLP